MPIPTHVQLKDPWRALSPEREEIMELQLQHELAPGHVLYGRRLRAVAERIDRDDVLFELIAPQNQLARVHLTWSRNQQSNPYPTTKLFLSWEEWVRNELSLDCEDNRLS
jgi:hypothetical protein